MIDFAGMNRAEVRKKLIDAHTAFKYELKEKSEELASLMHGFVDSAEKSGRASVSKKASAFTAISERITWLTANIECIESIGVFDDAKKSSDIKDDVRRRYNGLVRSLELSLIDSRAALQAMNGIRVDAIKKRQLLPFGDAARTQVGGNHAKLMKDLAMIGFLQQFGLKSSEAGRREL